MQCAQPANNRCPSASLQAFLFGAALVLAAPAAFAQSARAPATAASSPYGYSDDDISASPPAARQPAPSPASAASVSASPSAAIPAAVSAANFSALQIWAENDIGWSDRYYSSGVKIAYASPEIFVKGGLPLFFQDLLKFSPLAADTALDPAAYRLHFALAHEIHTPFREYDVAPPPGDHPYAGLLYVTAAFSSETRARLDALEVSVGVIGPSAQAQRAQNDWHRLIGARRVNGWDYQLRDEPILQLAWTRAGRYTWLRRGSLQMDWHPRLRLEVGTIRDYAAFGAQLRLGLSRDGLPRDFGIAGLHASPAFTRPAANLARFSPSGVLPDSAWLWLDFQGEAWLWNSSLDGNVWHKSASVHRFPWVAEAAVGLAAQWGGIRLSFAEVIRTREFRTQYKELSVHTTASLSFSF